MKEQSESPIKMKSNAEFYSSTHQKVDPCQKVGWDNVDKARKRYEFVSSLVPDTAKRIVDYGCGIGTFSEYVGFKEYVGVDVHIPFLHEAIEKYPKKLFLYVPYGNFDLECDCIVNIGAYTLAYDVTGQDYWNRITDDIKIQSWHAKTIIVNGYHDAVDYKDDKLFYHKLEDWIKLANELDAKIEFYIFEKHEFVAKLTFPK